jgi:hypothetical protein
MLAFLRSGDKSTYVIVRGQGGLDTDSGFNIGGKSHFIKAIDRHSLILVATLSFLRLELFLFSGKNKSNFDI